MLCRARVTVQVAVAVGVTALALAREPASASEAKPPDPSLGAVRILTVSELALDRSRYLVLDARGLTAYQHSHVPGSFPIDWREWTLEKPGALGLVFGDPTRWGRLVTPDAPLQGRLRALGLSNATPVAVVGDPTAWGEEGRIAWNLLYWGLAEVALLDGGFPAWREAGHPIETGETRKPAPGGFVLRLRGARRAESGDVLRALEDRRTLLDARTEEEFRGKKAWGQARGGHIPGATLVPHRRLVRPDGRYVSAEELRKLIGRPLKAPPITYCTGGVRAALLALLIEARLGLVASNYDGSMWEWSRDPTRPLIASKNGLEERQP